MAGGHEKRFEGLPREALADGRTVLTASTHTAKRRGLSKLDSIPPDHALHIVKCSSVHTIGMRFALDLIWLDEAGVVLQVNRDIGPRKLRRCRGAASVVETLAGEADAFLAAGLGARRSSGS
jgi:hypothetical protein